MQFSLEDRPGAVRRPNEGGGIEEASQIAQSNDQTGFKDELLTAQSCASSEVFKRSVPKPKRNLTETGRDE
jgi:hypothetical protein